jgi:hypothetical protein
MPGPREHGQPGLGTDVTSRDVVGIWRAQVEAVERREWAVRTRALLVAALAFLVVVALAAPARAAPEPLVGICAFPITHEFPKVHAREHPSPTSSSPFEGVDTGQVLVRITNLINGRSVDVHANSAAFFLRDGTVMFRGQSVTFFDSRRGDVPAGVWVINGDVRATLDAQGRVATVTGGVIRRDICAELA